MWRSILLLSTLPLAGQQLMACSCALEMPLTWCGTMDPSWYFPPDVIVLGEKLDEEAYGMHVKVLRVLQGNVAVDDTLMVWGDNGACCRPYVSTWTNGDTILWAFNETDFTGNIIDPFGPQLEQEGDYCINGCGVYWLGYAADTVFIVDPWEEYTILPGVTSMPIEEFWPAVSACGAVGIKGVEHPAGLSVRTTSDGVWLALLDPEQTELQVTDALGKAVLRRRWNGEALWLGDLATGVFFVQVERAGRRLTRSLYKP